MKAKKRSEWGLESGTREGKGISEVRDQQGNRVLKGAFGQQWKGGKGEGSTMTQLYEKSRSNKLFCVQTKI